MIEKHPVQQVKMEVSMKKFLAFALTLVLLLSLCVTGYAAPLRASAGDAEAQINVIFRDFGSCRQADSDGTWFYAVTDLDHNGRLELLAASVQASSLLPAAKVWELNADRSALQPCRLNIAENEVFANILTDSAETRYDKAKDAWFYLVNDFYQVSAEDAFVVKSAVVLNSGELEYGALAYEDIGPSGSRFTDTDDNPITVEDFGNIGDRFFKDSQKSSTSFEWFTAAAASQLNAFKDSYAVFTGEKAPSQTFAGAAAFPAGFLAVTKNPTSESHLPGESALFVANANAYTSLEWVFVAPDGGEYAAADFATLFPAASVSGIESTTLSIGNVSPDMSGWSVYCMFGNGSRVVWTNQAWLYVRSDVVIEDVDELFYVWFSDGAWVCPDCGNVCYGDYCPYCGFNLWEVWYEYYDDDAYDRMIEEYYIVEVDDTETADELDDVILVEDDDDAELPDDMVEVVMDDADDTVDDSDDETDFIVEDSDDDADYTVDDSFDDADYTVNDFDDDDDDDYDHLHRRKWSQLDDDWDLMDDVLS